MEITSKQRAKLKGLAQNLETIAQFGKNELSSEQIKMVDQMLIKRELIKCAVLESSPYTARELAELLAQETKAVPVQAIGRRFVLYRRNPKDPVITLD
ncbi:MAG: YhbY family RNA-binding protein [Candidatus Fimivivens sp.]